MVMQSVFELLKSLVPFPLFPSPSIFSRRQVTPSHSYPLVLFFCCRSYYGMCFLMRLVCICQFMMSRTFCVKSCLVLAFQLGTLCSGFFFLVYVGSCEVHFLGCWFWVFFKLDIFRQMHLRISCSFQLSVKIKNQLYACYKGTQVIEELNIHRIKSLLHM